MESQTITHVNYKANSYEYGKAGNRFKLYFENAEDLKKQMDSLADIGLNLESAEWKLTARNANTPGERDLNCFMSVVLIVEINARWNDDSTLWFIA